MSTRIKYDQLKDIPFKKPCRVATTSNIANLSSGAPNSVDGVSLSINDRVLVKSQSTSTQNGIYRVVTVGTGSNGSWVRDYDFSNNIDIYDGVGVFITSGTVNSNSLYYLTTPDIINVGSTSLTFSEFSGDVTGSGTANYVPRWITSSNISSTSSIYDNGTQVGIGLTSTSARLHVSAVTGPTGSTVVRVDGNSGELFTVVDNLVGSLFSVNDISGLPVLEVFSDNTTLIGSYLAPSLYTTKKSTVGTSSVDIYSFATASYDGAFVDYTIKNGANSRSGSIVANWNSSSIQFTENSTIDIGNTTGFTFSFVLSGSSAVLRGSASTTGWTVKTIIRSI